MVSINGAAGQAASVAIDGSWSLQVTGLTDGEAIRVATATDPAGNAASSGAFAFTVDTTTSESAIADAAVTTGTDSHLYINAANFNGGTTTLTGTAEAGETVMVSINGAASQAASVAIDGSWSLQVTGLTDGEAISAVATATDPAGNAASSGAFAFTVDTTTSESAITDPAVTTGTDSHLYINAANFNGGTTTLTGTAEAGDTVMVSINGAAGQAASVAIDGSWSLQVTGLTDGEAISAVATATDPAGNAASPPHPRPSSPPPPSPTAPVHTAPPSGAFAFTVDTTTSESAIADAAVTTGTDSHLYINAANFNGGTTTLTGTAEAGDTVMVSINGAAGQAASVAIDGSWSLQVTGLTDGEAIGGRHRDRPGRQCRLERRLRLHRRHHDERERDRGCGGDHRHR